ncbi:hypothetical protein CC86DRAFT_384283 [Ophiobolus disseminans]|uniref:Uncharacterized protein n=1 Tax=Ophiobolus disseminans TaxID=1469910 RepID=A0A6A6ZTR5_9PLEO|nr:hypothetical protein CC86DRAFT_384283 [Ophiobolus disseminans]
MLASHALDGRLEITPEEAQLRTQLRFRHDPLQPKQHAHRRNTCVARPSSTLHSPGCCEASDVNTATIFAAATTSTRKHRNYTSDLGRQTAARAVIFTPSRPLLRLPDTQPSTDRRGRYMTTDIVCDASKRSPRRRWKMHDRWRRQRTQDERIECVRLRDSGTPCLTTCKYLSFATGRRLAEDGIARSSVRLFSAPAAKTRRPHVLNASSRHASKAHPTPGTTQDSETSSTNARACRKQEPKQPSAEAIRVDTHLDTHCNGRNEAGRG